MANPYGPYERMVNFFLPTLGARARESVDRIMAEVATDPPFLVSEQHDPNSFDVAPIVDDPRLAAENLLIDVLPRELYVALAVKGEFEVKPTRTESVKIKRPYPDEDKCTHQPYTYRFYRNRKTELIEADGKTWSACIAPKDPCPDADRIVAEYLLVAGGVEGERRYLETANLTLVSSGYVGAPPHIGMIPDNYADYRLYVQGNQANARYLAARTAALAQHQAVELAHGMPQRRHPQRATANESARRISHELLMCLRNRLMDRDGGRLLRIPRWPVGDPAIQGPVLLTLEYFGGDLNIPAELSIEDFLRTVEITRTTEYIAALLIPIAHRIMYWAELRAIQPARLGDGWGAVTMDVETGLCVKVDYGYDLMTDLNRAQATVGVYVRPA